MPLFLFHYEQLRSPNPDSHIVTCNCRFVTPSLAFPAYASPMPASILDTHSCWQVRSLYLCCHGKYETSGDLITFPQSHFVMLARHMEEHDRSVLDCASNHCRVPAEEDKAVEVDIVAQEVTSIFALSKFALFDRYVLILYLDREGPPVIEQLLIIQRRRHQLWTVGEGGISGPNLFVQILVSCIAIAVCELLNCVMFAPGCHANVEHQIDRVAVSLE